MHLRLLLALLALGALGLAVLLQLEAVRARLPMGTAPVSYGAYPSEQPVYELPGGAGCDREMEACAGSLVRCTTRSRCDSGNLCARMDSGAKHGYCLEECDPNAPACSGGAACVTLASSTMGACMPAGTAQRDSICGGQDPNADTMDMTKTCAKRMICIIFAQGASDGLCLPRVETCDAGACASGSACLSLPGDRGACARDCATSTCPQDTRCIAIQEKRICGRDGAAERREGRSG